MKLSKNSWHYWLASNFKSDAPDSYAMKKKTKNFCAYSRAVLANLIMLLIIVALISFFFIPLFIVPIYLLWTGKHDANLAELTITMWTVVLGSISVFGVLYGLHVLKERRKNRPLTINEVMKKPSFVKLWFRSLKEKTCFLVEFED